MAAICGLFYGCLVMAADADVQYFSHLNGLTLGNNWGDLIRLLDTCLVSGLALPSVTSASLSGQGDLTLTFFAEHNAMQFQIVELSGFAASELNQKYRIKGVPNTTQLILKPSQELGISSVTTLGTAKLASLGYDIVFRDSGDVKRVYRAKNPSMQHPFIRVDESLASDTGTYASTYARYAMVGLLEHMDHIDDYENPNVLQLPFDPTNPAKNWKITGTGNSVVRGWSKWYFATSDLPYFGSSGTNEGSAGARWFTLCGNTDCFYINRSTTPNSSIKYISGVGLFNSPLGLEVIPNWYLMTYMSLSSANSAINPAGILGGEPLAYDVNPSSFFTTKYSPLSKLSQHTVCKPLIPDFRTGNSGLYHNGSSISPLEVPFYDTDKYLRGSLKHITYCGDLVNATKTATIPTLSGSSMYVYDGLDLAGISGGLYFYLGELE